MMEKLEQLFKEKKWQDCVELAENLKNNLNDYNDTQIKNFYWWAGQAYKNLKQYEQAEEQFHLLQEKFPNQHQGYEGLVNVAQHQKNHQRILEQATIFQEKFPNMWQGYWWTGHVYKELKKYPEAEQQFNLLTETLPNLHQGIQGLVESANHEQDWEKAIKHSLQLQAKKPDMWQAYWWAGHAYKNLKQYEQAEEQFNLLAEIFPNLHQGIQGLVESANHEQNWEKAIKYSLQLQEKKPDMWQAYWWAGHAYKNLKQYEQAEEQFNLLTATLPSLHQGIQGLVESANHEQSWEKAIKYSLQMQENKPTMWQGYWWAGNAYKHLKQYEQAEEQFNLLQEKIPNQHQGYEGLVSIAQHQQNKYLIIERATTFQQKFPQMWHSYWWIGHAYKDLYEYDKAETTFNQLIEVLPNDHRGYEGLVNVAQHQQDWQKVIQLTPDFINKFPNMWQGYWYLGQAHKNLANYGNAKQQFELIKEKFPNTHFYYQGMIDIANHQNEWQDLLQFSEEYIIAFPERIDGYFNKGMALKNLKRFDEAEQFFIELAEQFPNHTQPLTGLANIYHTLRKNTQSIEILEKANKIFPNQQGIITQLINNYLGYNEPDKAIILFDNHIDNKKTIANQLLLARIYQVKNGNIEYVDRLERLYQQYPDDISVAIAYANALINFTLEDN